MQLHHYTFIYRFLFEFIIYGFEVFAQKLQANISLIRNTITAFIIYRLFYKLFVINKHFVSTFSFIPINFKRWCPSFYSYLFDHLQLCCLSLIYNHYETKRIMFFSSTNIFYFMLTIAFFLSCYFSLFLKIFK